MNARETKLAGAWLEEIMLGDKPLKPLSLGRLQKLELMKNRCFVENSSQSEIEAMIEVIYVMAHEAPEVVAYSRKTPSERSDVLSDFAIIHEAEIESVIAQVLDAVSRIDAAKMEGTGSGKEMRHA
jgi:hypothetical protein